MSPGVTPTDRFAAGGDSVVMLFEGSYEEQLAIFRTWHQHAEENDRPRVFFDHGLEALVQLGKTIMPPMPETDTAATEHANTVIEKARASDHGR